jgi:retron-type reverse transcriptase
MESFLIDLECKLLEGGYNKEYRNLCIQYSERLLENNLPVIFDRDHLAMLLGVNVNYLSKLVMITEQFYKLARIPKRKSGQFRELSLPFKTLKEVQRWILHNILYKIEVSSYAKGFKVNESIVENAKPHVKKECVLKIDLKNFFDNISYNSVFRVFNYYGYTKEVSFFLARLCTFKGRLPQGAPTSPYLSNIICKRLDKRLSAFATVNNFQYTRYADDITFSGKRKLEKKVDYICDIIENEKFIINKEKLKIQFKTRRQMVTGLIVNEKLSVPMETKKLLRQQIYYCKTYGVSSHMAWLEIDKSNYKDYLYGLAYFIKMVEPGNGEKFLKGLDEIHWDY